MNKEFSQGLRAGIPICLGYFSVSIGFGIMAIQSGLPIWTAVVISLTNLTSAGQAAGVVVIAGAGSYLEMILTELLINLRYCLMALSLSQHRTGFSLPHRAAAAHGITDEIFGVCASRPEPITPFYMYGITVIATIGWVGGTFVGAVCGAVLPELLTDALGIMLYGMFIAVIIPPIRTSWTNLAVILIAAAVSCVIYYCLPVITSGFAIIISAVIAAAILAVIAPVSDDGEDAPAPTTFAEAEGGN